MWCTLHGVCVSLEYLLLSAGAVFGRKSEFGLRAVTVGLDKWLLFRVSQ